MPFYALMVSWTFSRRAVNVAVSWSLVHDLGTMLEFLLLFCMRAKNSCMGNIGCMTPLTHITGNYKDTGSIVNGSTVGKYL